MASGSVTIKICRCCLENQAESVGLFTTLDEFQNKICDLLLECGGIPVSEEDCFPKYICAVCLWDLCTAVRFRMRCLKSQEVLQKEQFVVEELQQADVAGPVLEQDILTELNVNITDDFTSGENSEGKVDHNFKDPGDVKESIEKLL
ncbi:uncharacterized protein LOC128736758 [Sabethes cyaneus]|uniref:uncharacterized protein LOC128736758 n=1 Tax=Sabethes cyaneus TaxID=53552 RepID=UPI00237ECF48|nr:uncharacterized protein LOC128736758 [Sabethes cyaneus]